MSPQRLFPTGELKVFSFSSVREDSGVHREHEFKLIQSYLRSTKVRGREAQMPTKGHLTGIRQSGLNKDSGDY